MLLENIRTIDSGVEFNLIAQGNTAEVYLYDDNKIIKLFRQNMPTHLIISEFEKVKCIQSSLNNIPEVYEIIMFKERYGIIYEKIIGTDMIHNILKNLGKVKQYSKSLAYIHFELHANKVELNLSVKSKLSSEIDNVADLSGEEKNIIKKYMNSLPDNNALCHFDFHPGNIIMQNKNPIIIDWMTACTGDSNADVARTYLLLQYGELQHVNWVVNKLVCLFKRYIGKKYINEYKQCSGISNSDFEQWLLPIAAGRLVEWISDNEKEHILKFIKKELSELY